MSDDARETADHYRRCRYCDGTGDVHAEFCPIRAEDAATDNLDACLDLLADLYASATPSYDADALPVGDSKPTLATVPVDLIDRCAILLDQLRPIPGARQ